MVSNRRCNPPTTRTPHTTHVSVGARTRPRVAQYPLPLPLALAHSLPRSFSLSFTPRAEPHRIPRDKTKPGRVPSFIRGRGAASGSSAAPSGPVRLSRQTFSPAESTGVRPVLNPPSPAAPVVIVYHPRASVPDHHLEQTPQHPRPNARGLRAS